MHYLFESTAARLAQGPQLKVDTTPSLMMEESLALVRTLNWKIVTPLLIGLHSLDWGARLLLTWLHCLWQSLPA